MIELHSFQTSKHARICLSSQPFGLHDLYQQLLSASIDVPSEPPQDSSRSLILMWMCMWLPQLPTPLLIDPDSRSQGSILPLIGPSSRT